MQSLRSGIFVVCLSAGVAAAAPRAPRADPVEFSLGRFEAPGACPAVSSYTQQLRQSRALSVQAGKVDVDARVFPRQQVSDLKTRRDLRDCAVEVGKAMPREQLLNGGGPAEAAVTESLKRCMAGKGNEIDLVGVSLRRSSTICQ
jgi:hypothetical protein